VVEAEVVLVDEAGGVENKRGEEVGVEVVGKSSNGRLGTSCEAGGTGCTHTEPKDYIKMRAIKLRADNSN